MRKRSRVPHDVRRQDNRNSRGRAMISDIRIQRASREWTIVADVDSSTEEIVITF